MELDGMKINKQSPEGEAGDISIKVQKAGMVVA